MSDISDICIREKIFNAVRDFYQTALRCPEDQRTLVMHPIIWNALLKEIHLAGGYIDSYQNMTYEGMRVIRSFDVTEGDILVF